ncbi:MAG: metallophosphoesterase [Actinomycetota bacterium]|nr:metallophosphoesterase [Actinomycetota bacterium]
MTASDPGPGCVRIAAAGDLHCRDSARDQVAEAFAGLRGRADVILLAGDLTTHGEPAQAAVLADACRGLGLPVYTVLGNHDWHANRTDEVRAVLEDAGIVVLDGQGVVCAVRGTEIGIVGAKGFVGGFPGSHLPDFGEPLLRELYAESTREVEALDRALKDVAHCPVRVVVLHYAPTTDTLEGEPEAIWTMLGTDRLAAPIAEHEPDLVLHGHAHAGRFQGAIGDVPVHNVSVPVMGQDFWVFELSGLERATTPLH